MSVGAERLAADRIFINVGGRASVPQMPGIEEVPYLTNSSILDLDFLPHHLIIVGGGYIGLEFSQMYRRFGSEVTMIQRAPHLAKHEDEDVSFAWTPLVSAFRVSTFQSMARRFSLTSTAPVAIARYAAHIFCWRWEGAPIRTTWGSPTQAWPSTNGFIIADDQLRTSVPGIWALGDCNGKGEFTRTAFNDAEIVAANLLDANVQDNAPREVSDRITAYALYIDPPLGRVGLTEAEVRKSGHPALIGRRPMTRVGRAVEKGETQGFMKVIVDARTHEILGAAILGTGGDEAIHSIRDAMYAKAPYTVIQRAMHIHPTVSELIPTMLGELQPLSVAAGAPQ